MDFGASPHRFYADGISDGARMQSGSSGAAFVIDTGKSRRADRNASAIRSRWGHMNAPVPTYMSYSVESVLERKASEDALHSS